MKRTILLKRHILAALCLLFIMTNVVVYKAFIASGGYVGNPLVLKISAQPEIADSGADIAVKLEYTLNGIEGNWYNTLITVALGDELDDSIYSDPDEFDKVVQDIKAGNGYINTVAYDSAKRELYITLNPIVPGNTFTTNLKIKFASETTPHDTTALISAVIVGELRYASKDENDVYIKDEKGDFVFISEDFRAEDSVTVKAKATNEWELSKKNVTSGNKKYGAEFVQIGAGADRQFVYYVDYELDLFRKLLNGERGALAPSHAVLSDTLPRDAGSQNPIKYEVISGNDNYTAVDEANGDITLVWNLSVADGHFNYTGPVRDSSVPNLSEPIVIRVYYDSDSFIPQNQDYNLVNKVSAIVYPIKNGKESSCSTENTTVIPRAADPAYNISVNKTAKTTGLTLDGFKKTTTSTGGVPVVFNVDIKNESNVKIDYILEDSKIALSSKGGSAISSVIGVDYWFSGITLPVFDSTMSSKFSSAQVLAKLTPDGDYIAVGEWNASKNVFDSSGAIWYGVMLQVNDLLPNQEITGIEVTAVVAHVEIPGNLNDALANITNTADAAAYVNNEVKDTEKDSAAVTLTSPNLSAVVTKAAADSNTVSIGSIVEGNGIVSYKINVSNTSGVAVEAITVKDSGPTFAKEDGTAITSDDVDYYIANAVTVNAASGIDYTVYYLYEGLTPGEIERTTTFSAAEKYKEFEVVLENVPDYKGVIATNPQTVITVDYNVSVKPVEEGSLAPSVALQKVINKAGYNIKYGEYITEDRSSNSATKTIDYNASIGLSKAVNLATIPLYTGKATPNNGLYEGPVDLVYTITVENTGELTIDYYLNDKLPDFAGITMNAANKTKFINSFVSSWVGSGASSVVDNSTADEIALVFKDLQPGTHYTVTVTLRLNPLYSEEGSVKTYYPAADIYSAIKNTATAYYVYDGGDPKGALESIVHTIINKPAQTDMTLTKEMLGTSGNQDLHDIGSERTYDIKPQITTNVMLYEVVIADSGIKLLDSKGTEITARISGNNKTQTDYVWFKEIWIPNYSKALQTGTYKVADGTKAVVKVTYYDSGLKANVTVNKTITFTGTDDYIKIVMGDKSDDNKTIGKIVSFELVVNDVGPKTINGTSADNLVKFYDANVAIKVVTGFANLEELKPSAGNVAGELATIQNNCWMSYGFYPGGSGGTGDPKVSTGIDKTVVRTDPNVSLTKTRDKASVLLKDIRDGGVDIVYTLTAKSTAAPTKEMVLYDTGIFSTIYGTTGVTGYEFTNLEISANVSNDDYKATVYWLDDTISNPASVTLASITNKTNAFKVPLTANKETVALTGIKAKSFIIVVTAADGKYLPSAYTLTVKATAKVNDATAKDKLSKLTNKAILYYKEFENDTVYKKTTEQTVDTTVTNGLQVSVGKSQASIEYYDASADSWTTQTSSSISLEELLTVGDTKINYNMNVNTATSQVMLDKLTITDSGIRFTGFDSKFNTITEKNMDASEYSFSQIIIPSALVAYFNETDTKVYENGSAVSLSTLFSSAANDAGDKVLTLKTDKTCSGFSLIFKNLPKGLNADIKCTAILYKRDYSEFPTAIINELTAVYAFGATTNGSTDGTKKVTTVVDNDIVPKMSVIEKKVTPADIHGTDLQKGSVPVTFTISELGHHASDSKFTMENYEISDRDIVFFDNTSKVLSGFTPLEKYFQMNEIVFSTFNSDDKLDVTIYYIDGSGAEKYKTFTEAWTKAGYTITSEDLEIVGFKATCAALSKNFNKASIVIKGQLNQMSVADANLLYVVKNTVKQSYDLSEDVRLTNEASAIVNIGGKKPPVIRPTKEFNPTTLEKLALYAWDNTVTATIGGIHNNGDAPADIVITDKGLSFNNNEPVTTDQMYLTKIAVNVITTKTGSITPKTLANISKSTQISVTVIDKDGDEHVLDAGSPFKPGLDNNASREFIIPAGVEANEFIVTCNDMDVNMMFTVSPTYTVSSMELAEAMAMEKINNTVTVGGKFGTDNLEEKTATARIGIIETSQELNLLIKNNDPNANTKSYMPGSEVTFSIYVGNDQESTATRPSIYIDPLVYVELPFIFDQYDVDKYIKNVDFKFGTIDYSGNVTDTSSFTPSDIGVGIDHYEYIDNILRRYLNNNVNHNLIGFAFDGELEYGECIKITFTVHISPYSPADNFEAIAYATSDEQKVDSNLTAEKKTVFQAGLGEILDDAQQVLFYDTVSIPVNSSNSMKLKVEVQGALDNGVWSFEPAYGVTEPGNWLKYKITIENRSTEPVTNVRLNDLLPYFDVNGDPSLIGGANRISKWDPYLDPSTTIIGEVIYYNSMNQPTTLYVDADYNLYLTEERNLSKEEALVYSGTEPSPDIWTKYSDLDNEDISKQAAILMDFGSLVMDANNSRIEFIMYLRAPIEIEAAPGMIAWNTASLVYSEFKQGGTTDSIILKEPIETKKVGITFDLSETKNNELTIEKIVKSENAVENNNKNSDTFTFTITGPVGYKENVTFTTDAAEMSVTLPYTFTITGNGSVKFSDLPVGAYTVKEINIPAWYVAYNIDQKVKLTGNSSELITIENHRLIGDLTIMKTVFDDQFENKDDEFVFSIKSLDNKFNEEYSIKADGSPLVIEDLSIGEYVVKELGVRFNGEGSLHKGYYDVTVNFNDGSKTVLGEDGIVIEIFENSDPIGLSVVNTRKDDGKITVFKRLVDNENKTAEWPENTTFKVSIINLRTEEIQSIVLTKDYRSHTFENLTYDEYSVWEEYDSLKYVDTIDLIGPSVSKSAFNIDKVTLTPDYKLLNLRIINEILLPGSLRVDKYVVSTGNNYSGKFDFVLVNVETKETREFSIDCVNNQGGITFNNLIPGKYAVYEIENPNGVFIANANVSVGQVTTGAGLATFFTELSGDPESEIPTGVNLVCEVTVTTETTIFVTFMNRRLDTGSITITKELKDESGNLLNSTKDWEGQSFKVTIKGIATGFTTSAVLDSSHKVVTLNNLPLDTYTVVEEIGNDDIDKYWATYSTEWIELSMGTVSGEVLVTNTLIDNTLGSLRVIKTLLDEDGDVLNEWGGAYFDITITGPDGYEFTTRLSNNVKEAVVNNLEFGNYTVTESFDTSLYEGVIVSGNVNITKINKDGTVGLTNRVLKEEVLLGELRVTKTLNSALGNPLNDWDSALFTITISNGTITRSVVLDDSQKGFVFTDLPLGSYTVTESYNTSLYEGVITSGSAILTELSLYGNVGLVNQLIAVDPEGPPPPPPTDPEGPPPPPPTDPEGPPPTDPEGPPPTDPEGPPPTDPEGPPPTDPEGPPPTDPEEPAIPETIDVVEAPVLAPASIDDLTPTEDPDVFVWLDEEGNALGYYTVGPDGELIELEDYNPLGGLNVVKDNPKTGDTTNAAIFLIVMASGLCAYLLGRKYKFAKR